MRLRDVWVGFEGKKDWLKRCHLFSPRRSFVVRLVCGLTTEEIPLVSGSSFCLSLLLWVNVGVCFVSKQIHSEPEWHQHWWMPRLKVLSFTVDSAVSPCLPIPVCLSLLPSLRTWRAQIVSEQLRERKKCQNNDHPSLGLPLSSPLSSSWPLSLCPNKLVLRLRCLLECVWVWVSASDGMANVALLA